MAGSSPLHCIGPESELLTGGTSRRIADIKELPNAPPTPLHCIVSWYRGRCQVLGPSPTVVASVTAVALVVLLLVCALSRPCSYLTVQEQIGVGGSWEVELLCTEVVFSTVHTRKACYRLPGRRRSWQPMTRKKFEGGREKLRCPEGRIPYWVQ